MRTELGSIRADTSEGVMNVLKLRKEGLKEELKKHPYSLKRWGNLIRNEAATIRASSKINNGDFLKSIQHTYHPKDITPTHLGSNVDPTTHIEESTLPLAEAPATVADVIEPVETQTPPVDKPGIDWRNPDRWKPAGGEKRGRNRWGLAAALVGVGAFALLAASCGPLTRAKEALPHVT